MTSTIVIGAGFGDEGKGLVTDYLARTGEYETVCRFSGGAQAAHTVQLPDGRRHVFSHFGSGTLAGLPTFLGSKFISNPILFSRERKDLVNDFSIQPEVTVCQVGRVSTYVDMILNVMLEKKRGDSRHGSCGIGIGETVVRSQNGFCLTADDTRYLNLKYFMSKVIKNWVPSRTAELGLTAADDPELWETLHSESTMLAWCHDARAFSDSVTMSDRLVPDGDVLFEGAQGLLLDEEHEFFPHVTRSRTGVPYVARCVGEGGRAPVDEVVYVTRTYMTRHGAGPFPTEQSYEWLHDETNVPNDFQGSLRYGSLDVDLMRKAIDKDTRVWGLCGLATPRTSLAVTCVDQLVTSPSSIAAMFDMNLKLESWGPTYRDVQEAP